MLNYMKRMDYSQLASKDNVDKAAAALRAHGFETIFAANKEEALMKAKDLIPKGASVMNGSSRTLEQIGFVDYLKEGKHGWNNLHTAVLAEKDPAKQALMRRQAVVSDYYLGSVHALTETGEAMIASNSGSQLPHIVFTSPNVIFVVGTQKIVPDLKTAFDRLEKYVLPLEDVHMQELYGANTLLSKILIYKQERPKSGRAIRFILVSEQLGF